MKIDTCMQGEKLALVLPAEAVAELGWQDGDVLEGEIESGILRIVRSKTMHERAMEIARDGMDKYRNTLEALAKS